MGTNKMCLTTWRTKLLPVISILIFITALQVYAFSDSFYFEVKENSPPQTYVGKIATKPGFTYQFNDDPLEFDLDPGTGHIHTTDVSIDRESKDLYNLVILSSSPTYPIEVRIRILDQNDNFPSWPSSINTNLTFSESAPVGTKVIIDNAIDQDSGLLKYSIAPVSEALDEPDINSALPFKLHYNSSTSFLHLEVASKLDREFQSTYLVNITATDEDDQSSYAIFNVHLQDSNDSPPIFDQSDYSVSLNESMPKDVSILQVRATDADEEGNENSRISYYLTNSKETDFQIDPISGVISTTHDGPISCGTTTEKSANECWRICVFTVFATDYGMPRQNGRAYVTAKVYQKICYNNHAPIIKFRYFSKSKVANVDESVANGSVVAAVSVVDFDHGRNGQTSVELTGGNDWGHFRLDSVGNSHILRVNGQLDREKVSQYNLTILAYDHGSPRKSTSEQLLIYVQDQNDHTPTFEKESYEAAISETQHIAGLFVCALRAVDLDEGINAQIYYSLSGANSHYFKIDPNSGLVTTDKVIDREEIDFFDLKVTATDGGSNPKWVQVGLRVKVLDINDQIPKLLLLSEHSLSNQTITYEVEFQGGRFLDIELLAKDDDLDNNGTVDVTLLYDYNGLFRVESDSNSVKVTSTQPLNPEECSFFKILLLATDRAPPSHKLSSLSTIHVTVKGFEEAQPILYPRQYFSRVVLGGNSANFSILKLTVNDAEKASQVTFAIRSRDDLPKRLLVVNEQGELRLREDARQELLENAPTTLSFQVDCLGCIEDRSTAHLSLFLLLADDDELLQAPNGESNLRSKYVFQMQKNAPSGSTVGQLDVDLGQYDLHLVAGDIEGHFRLAGNAIIVNNPVDREVVSQFRLQLVALKSDFPVNIVVEVEILDSIVPDSQPHFIVPFDQVTVHERVPSMFVVRRLHVVNVSGNGSSIEYHLLENPHDLFVIDGNELKFRRTISAAVRESKKPISAILRVKIRVTDKTAVVAAAAPALVSATSCHLGNELTLFISINSSDSRSRARFIKRFYEFFISESTPINEQVFQLATRHLDDDSVRFAIVAGNVNNTFAVLATPGGFYIRNRLDRESIDLFLLNVALYDSRSSSHRNASLIALDTCQVLITVQDANDNSPVFSRPLGYRFSVPENVPKNFLVGRVTATDADIEANSRVVYSIAKSFYSDFVQIDPKTGYIWTNKEYDRESLPNFEITVLATDQPIDEDKLSAQVQIYIEILDANDNRPVFELPSNVSLTSPATDELLSGKLHVSEATVIGSIVAHFRAVDVDFESAINYRLVDAKNTATFELNSSGALIVARPLDREKTDNYRVTVEATDGKHTSAFDLIILIDDVNDCRPEWVNPASVQTELSIPENISIGSEIMQLSALDRDVGVSGLFHFAIENHTGSQKAFDIINSKLVVVNHLDYEKNRVHLLNVSLIESQSGQIASTRIIRLLVLDIIDCAPVFIQRSDTEVVRVRENIDIGSKLLTLQATDGDQNDILTFEIIRCNTHYHTHNIHDSNNCPLSLNSRNGEIININNLDREVIESINLQLSVRDTAGHTDKLKVIFLIEDSNDELPAWVSPAKILVSRETISKVNAIIGRVKAIDLDMGINSAITYSLDNNQLGEYIELDRYSGTLKVKRSLEHLTDRELIFNVTATDGGGLFTTDTVQLIRPELAGPTIQTEPVIIEIYENGPIGSQIAKLQCEPSEYPCQFHLINATDSDARNFQVSTWTGVITTTELIDRETRAERQLEVLVVSKLSLQHVQVQLKVLDINDNPPYLTNTFQDGVHLSESVLPGTQVFDLSRLIADEDTNNKFDYQIINCSLCDGTFSLNRKTGVLTLLSGLDSEKINKYRILFGVSDGIYLLTSLLDVFIDDENDNKPYFLQSVFVFSIEENTERGALVGQITGFDDDVNNKNLEYSVLSGTTELDSVLSVFSLDSRSGQITLSKRLDYEVDQCEYIFFVQASDGKYKSSPVKVLFRLINLPDNPPIFESTVYKFDVMENTLGDNVICVKAIDADLRNIEEVNAIDSKDELLDGKQQLPLKYSIETATSNRDSFSINPVTGCLLVSKPLDRESHSQINLTVVAEDGFFNATALIIVKVSDANDNFPVFLKDTPSVLRLEENVPVDTVVYTFAATDLDEAPNSYIKYEIVHNVSQIADALLPFVIGPIDGQLKVTGPIDREKVDHYDVIIRATDYGLKHSEISCRIEIEDLIDNLPNFPTPFIEVNLYENISVGEYVFQLDAKDADPTDEINYRIISGNSIGPFRIDDDWLVVSSKLNYEETSLYNLKINAIDKAGNLDTVNVKITVLNVMDERPVFFDSPFLVNWFENQLGVVDQYEAFPEDMTIPLEDESTPLYSHINYLLLNNYEDSFRLNASTGVLSVVKGIDREALAATNVDTTIELKLIAIDTRSRLSGEGQILVTIVDANDNVPNWDKIEYTFHWNENQPFESNSTIGQVPASDLDEADLLQYTLESDSPDSIFSIDNNGRIYTLSSGAFDREHRSVYQMKVCVSDSKHYATVPVNVVIDDINDCSPRVTKLNGVICQPANGEQFKVKLSASKFNLMVKRKFPLIGLQVSDCDSGVNGQVQLRMNNDALYSVLSVDQQHGLIGCDFKNSLMLRDILAKSPSVEITLADTSALGQLSSSVSVLLELSNGNSQRERQLLKDSYVELSISELSQVNSTLHRFELVHAVSDIHIYAGDVYGHFSIRDNQLLLLRPLDYESTVSFDLYLQATYHQKDHEEFQFIFVRINIQNENDNAPIFSTLLYNASILEEEEETFVTQVMATDLDSASSVIKYKLLNEDPIPFRVDADTGNIWSLSKIDREVNASFRLTVSAQDEGGLTSNCTVFVTIDDKNDNPSQFTRLFQVNITENTPIGSFVIQVTSIDRDEKGYSNVTYQLLTETTAFELDRTTGNLYVAGQLDREERAEYMLTVSADDGSWKSQTMLTIFILDEDDVAPRFDQKSYRFNVIVPVTHSPGATIVNRTIGHVRAFDMDAGKNGMVGYRLKSRSKYFAIDSHSGEITLKKWPNVYPEMHFLNQHFLTVIATDKGLVPQSSQVSVLVYCFSEFLARQSLENQPGANAMDSIWLIIPVDLANQTLLYTANSLLSVLNHEPSGLLESKYHQLFFSGQSKLEVNQSYLIKAENGFGELNIHLRVTEANLYTPTFLSDHNSTTVEEGQLAPIGPQLVDNFRALDQDASSSNNVINYQVNLTALHWNVNSSQYLAANYRDKYPHLFKRNLTASEIVSNIAELSSVLSPFSMNHSTGELTLTHSLDFELITRYSLLVSASDNAWYRRVGSLPYDIFVGDIYDYVDSLDPKSLQIDSTRPDPMSIGVILVIFFFLVLIFVISTSFFFYHNQKKNHLQEVPISQRKLFLNSFSPYVPSNSQLPGQAAHPPRTSRLPVQAPVKVNGSSILWSPSQPVVPPTSQAIHQASAGRMHLTSSCKPGQFSNDLALTLNQRAHNSAAANQMQSMKRPDIVVPSNASESASVVASRIQQQQLGGSLLYEHTNSETTDNYSNILASAEHYDLENASSIAPSEIDIVYHYKGFRNRDTLSAANQKHAPLSRLSPSVSELSSMPRIVTLQDLSPHPMMSRTHMRKQANPMALSSSTGAAADDDVAFTENSFNCSEFGENYDLSRRNKSAFPRAW